MMSLFGLRQLSKNKLCRNKVGRSTLTVFLLLLLSACSANSELDKNNEIEKNQNIVARIKDNPDIIQHHKVTLPDHSLHYVSSPHEKGGESKTSLVFVHGTPGSWGTFSRYFEDKQLVKDFSLNSIDRPGWGESGYGNRSFPVSLMDQSELIGPILQDIWKHNGHHKVIVIGHSLGGSLVPKLAADYPQYIKGVIILAGDLDPELSEARWFNNVLDWTPDFLLPDKWMHSNNEVMAIQPSLSSLQTQFAQITMPITVLQGTDDTLVRPGSAEKAPEIFKSSDVKVIFLEGASHIINHTHTQDVKKAIYDMANKT